MICKCIKCVTSKRFPKSERDIQNGDDIDRTEKRQFYSPRKALETFRRFNVCLKGLNMHFGFEKKIKEKQKLFIS